jgi:uroporphyrin-III C-methyltransferase
MVPVQQTASVAPPPRISPAVTDTPAAPAAAPITPASEPPAATAPDTASADTATPSGATPAAPPRTAGLSPWTLAAAALLLAATTAALVLAWNTQQRVKGLEAELVRRQQDSGTQATEARTLARQAEVAAREAVAKLALLEARVAETALQRGQFEELLQSLARSRDENVLADLDAAVRVALQQSAITGSTEPLVVTLRQADERLARLNQPRLERVRRAVAQDLERTRAAAGVDVALLSIRLDEAVRGIDELPLLAQPTRSAAARRESEPKAVTAASTVPASAAPASAAATLDGWTDRARAMLGHVWSEARGLVRVSRIDGIDPLLVAPEQAFFLRENLKLRLLNARLALLSRQFDTAQTDLREAQNTLARFFDGSQRRVGLTQDLLRQVAAQARQLDVPRPDTTLAAIAAAAVGR